jgi:hypothetical protein
LKINLTQYWQQIAVFLLKNFITRFLATTKKYRERIAVYTARDKFHLQFFDPAEIVERLRNEGYKVVVNDWSDYRGLLSEYNADNKEFQKLDTNYSCYGYRWMDCLEVLPDGGWQICSPCLEAFGDIFSDSLEDVAEFRRGLSLHYEEGCTECLKYFKVLRKEFEKYKATKKLRA